MRERLKRQGLQRKGVQQKGLQKKELQQKGLQKKDLREEELQRKDLREEELQKKKLRYIIRLLVVSVTLHGGLLFIRLPQRQSTSLLPADISSDAGLEKRDESEDAIAIATLPLPARDSSSAEPPEPESAPPVTPLQDQSNQPQLPAALPPTVPELPTTVEPSASPAVAPEDNQFAIVEPQHSEPADSLEEPNFQDPTQETPSNASNDPVESPPFTIENGLVQIAEGFPHVTGATEGCFGSVQCNQVRDSGSYHQVADSLAANMRSAGYQVSELEDMDLSGHRVFEIKLPDYPDQPFYLNVYSEGIGSAVYVMSVEVMPLDTLRALPAST